jgi:hypothetical protein
MAPRCPGCHTPDFGHIVVGMTARFAADEYDVVERPTPDEGKFRADSVCSSANRPP